jgi:plasmid stabilization system protein ParE
VTGSVHFTPAARADVIEAFDWYESRAAGLGSAFQAEMDRQIVRLSENALLFPVIYADVRRARLRRFPYGLFFRIETGDIFVLACFHASRDPRRLEERS